MSSEYGRSREQEKVVQERPLEEAYFHDVGMYRDKSVAKVLQDLKGILTSQSIGGKTEKGAQLSKNAGPTNWEAFVSIRINANVPNVGQDIHAPSDVSWYMTGAKGRNIDLTGLPIEVVVNGRDQEETQELAQAAREMIRQEGLDVRVNTIDQLLRERWQEIALQIHDEEFREEFLSLMGSESFEVQKQVGELAGHHSAEGFARTLEQKIPDVIVQLYRDLEQQLGSESAELFSGLFDQASYGNQILFGWELLGDYQKEYKNVVGLIERELAKSA